MLPNAALHSLLTGLTGALEAHVRPDTGLFDPLDDQPSPADHYGHVCAALALACAGKRHWDRGRLALQAWLGLPADRLGHLPFNRLALLLLREVLGAEGLTAADARLIDTGLRRCTLRHRYPSNNWSLLAQTCRLIEAPAHKKAHESRRLCALFERWTTPKGCFIDFPENPGKHFSTPLAYHHKALFLAALSCWFHEDAALANHARRLCDWLVHCWDPAGYAGGFGRSTHSLFGDGCLIGGLILLGIDKTDSQPITALAQRIAQQRRSDGLLWLNPAGHESGKASWDSYMHLSVYNAWAAAVIGVAGAIRQNRPSPKRLNAIRWLAASNGVFHDERAGIASLRTPSGLVALISTHGQPPQSFSREHADFRYAGGTIVHLKSRTNHPVTAPGLRITRDEIACHPILAGWAPTFRVGEATYALDLFDTCELAGNENRLRLVLTGRPHALFKPPPEGILERILATLDWRFLGGKLSRIAVLRRPTLDAVRARLVIELAELDGQLHMVRQLELQTTVPATYLNPSGSVLCRDLTYPDVKITPEGAAPLESVHYEASIPGCNALAERPRNLDRAASSVRKQEYLIAPPHFLGAALTFTSRL